jgi:hypothetical protein
MVVAGLGDGWSFDDDEGGALAGKGGPTSSDIVRQRARGGAYVGELGILGM